MKKFPSSDPDYNLFSLLFQTTRAMFRVRARELAQYHISPRQSTLLFIIQALGDNATLAEMASWLLLEVHSVSESISRMERDGLVRKVREGKNRLRVVLTEKGIQAHHQSSKRESVHKLLSCLSAEERLQLGSSLRKLRSTALQEAPWGYELSFESM